MASPALATRAKGHGAPGQARAAERDSMTETDAASSQQATPTDPQAMVRQLLELLDLEEIDVDLYRGPARPGASGRVFGGQVIAQALIASMRSVDPSAAAHSLHAYFMRPGDNEHPIVYRVERDFDGRSFTTRRVIALQRGRPILNMAASFQRPEGGLAHQAEMPRVPEPESLPPPDGVPPGRPIEMRVVASSPASHPESRVMWWIRTVAPIGDDPDAHRAVLAFASDLGLLGASLLPHGLTFRAPGLQAASLDHALWLHDEFRADEWLLYVMESPWSGGARGFNRGQVFRRDGRLVASVAQEGLIRMRQG